MTLPDQTGDLTINARQRAMLIVLLNGPIAIGLAEFIDPDFKELCDYRLAGTQKGDEHTWAIITQAGIDAI